MNYETLNKNHVSHASQKFFRKQTLESKHPYSKMLCVKCTNKYNKDSKQIRICLGTKNRSFLKSVCFAEEPSPISIKRAFVKVFHWPNTYQCQIRDTIKLQFCKDQFTCLKDCWSAGMTFHALSSGIFHCLTMSHVK